MKRLLIVFAILLAFFQISTPTQVVVGSCLILSGSGSPEGAVTGKVCDMYLRTNGSTATTLYVKESGVGNTGWAAVGGAAGGTITVEEEDGTPSVADVDTIKVTNDTLTDNGDGSVSIDTGGGGGGGGTDKNSYIILPPGANEPPASAFATLDTRNSHPTLDFDGATDEEAVFTAQMPITYPGSGITVNTYWALTSATSGSLRVQAAIERVDASSLDIDADSFASFNSAGGTAPGTTGQIIQVNIAFANGAEMDSVAAGEQFRLKIRRDADGTSGTDDIATDAELLLVVIVVPGTGGNTTFTSAFGSESATAVAGDVNFLSNAPAIQRYTGSAWAQWGPVYPLTPPVSGDFAWVNQGSATVATTNGGVHLSAPLNASIGWRLRTKAAPATPYTITAVFLASPLAVDFHQWGLVFRQSSDDKLHVFTIQTNPAADNAMLNSVKYTNNTTFSAAYNSQRFRVGNVVHLRIEDNGTNRVCRYSADGLVWYEFSTIGRTDFLTADQVGWGANPENGTYALGVTLLSWKQE